MSDNILRFIPTEPDDIPDMARQQLALDLLTSYVPQTDEISVNVTVNIEFVDPGINLQRVSCPNCTSDLEIEW